MESNHPPEFNEAYIFPDKQDDDIPDLEKINKKGFNEDEFKDGDDVDIDEDTCDEFFSYLHLMNIFVCYHKNIFSKGPNSHMFENINYEDPTSTNRCMEELMEEIYKLQEASYSDAHTLYSPGELKIDECDELYVLNIKGEDKFVCKKLIPLLKHVAEMDDWNKISWSVLPLKTDS